MIEVEIKGFRQIADLANRFPAVAEKHVNKAIQRSLIRIQDKGKQYAPFGTSGNLRQNWVLKLGRFEGSLGSGAKANGFPYGSSVEFGTSPHRMPVSTNQPFLLWAQRKGLNPYAVARSIAKKGSKANPFFQKSIDETEEKIDEEFDKAINGILEEI